MKKILKFMNKKGMSSLIAVIAILVPRMNGEKIVIEKEVEKEVVKTVEVEVIRYRDFSYNAFTPIDIEPESMEMCRIDSKNI